MSNHTAAEKAAHLLHGKMLRSVSLDDLIEAFQAAIDEATKEQRARIEKMVDALGEAQIAAALAQVGKEPKP